MSKPYSLKTSLFIISSCPINSETLDPMTFFPFGLSSQNILVHWKSSNLFIIHHRHFKFRVSFCPTLSQIIHQNTRYYAKYYATLLE